MQTVTIPDAFTLERKPRELTLAVKEGLAIHDYLEAKISLGELTERLGMDYMDARDWLHNKEIPTLRQFADPDLEKIADQNHETLKMILSA